jgi:hypothetical protein
VRLSPGDVPAQLCLVPLAGRPRCQNASPGSQRVRVPGTYPGRWTLSARVGEEDSRALVVRPRARRLVVLAVGDSLVKPVVTGMRDDLRRRADVVVRKEVHHGSGLTRDEIDWIPHARKVAARVRPDVVLVFMGAGDGYPIDGVHCCEPPWIKRYVPLQRRMIRAFAQEGRTRVYWSLLPAPAPSRGNLRYAWAALNQAFTLATADDSARLFDTNPMLSPGFEYRRRMRWHGRSWAVRRSDGFHLSLAGGRIVADAFLRQLRADGIDNPPRP